MTEHCSVRYSDTIYSANFSPDGKLLVTGTGQGHVVVWNAESGKQEVVLRGHDDVVHSVQFSPCGTTLCSGSWDNRALLWSIAERAVVAEFAGHKGYVLGVAFDPSGKRLAIASSDETASLWDVETRKMTLVLNGHSNWVWNARFASDGKKVLTASCDSTARIWDAFSGACTAVLRHSIGVNSASFSRDSRQVLTSSWDSTAMLWDAETGAVLVKLSGNSTWVTSASFSPDGLRTMTCHDTMAIVWDAATGKKQFVLPHGDRIHNAAFSMDGKRVVTASRDRTATIWNIDLCSRDTGPLPPEMQAQQQLVYNANLQQTQLQQGQNQFTGTTEDILAQTPERSPSNGMLSGRASILISRDDLEVKRDVLLGKGSYARVYEALYHDHIVAAKVFSIDMHDDDDPDALNKLRVKVEREAAALTKVYHPNVVRYYGLCVDFSNPEEPFIAIVTEKLEGSVHRMIHRDRTETSPLGRLSLLEVCNVLLGISRGLLLIHHEGMVHLDLKPANVFYRKRSCVKLDIVIADFGLSIGLGMSSRSAMMGFRGSPAYMSPEQLRPVGRAVTSAADMYAFGVIIWELTTLQSPWKGTNPLEIAQLVAGEGMRLEFPEQLPEPGWSALVDLAKQCFNADPLLRPTAGQATAIIKTLENSLKG
eukprot:comp21835_c1_seq7/m.49294 comp21835_c1_seq7/g.49294  ORF comp21835_c1_seq7/g.49294 comp21835_c1_seq7/m.49294 type:complete len:650 (+) comp21835_c1_seq7:154-2103(+)